MMNKLTLGLFAVAALAVGTSFAQSPKAQDPATEIAELKRQVARLQADVNLLKQSNAAGDEAEQKLQSVMAYIEAQAKAAAGLQKVLADSEAKGFTFGINPESREVLLAGFNSFAEVLQSDVPGDDEPEE